MKSSGASFFLSFAVGVEGFKIVSDGFDGFGFGEVFASGFEDDFPVCVQA
jgi:hypothetical protein